MIHVKASLAIVKKSRVKFHMAYKGIFFVCSLCPLKRARSKSKVKDLKFKDLKFKDFRFPQL